MVGVCALKFFSARSLLVGLQPACKKPFSSYPQRFHFVLLGPVWGDCGKKVCKTKAECSVVVVVVVVVVIIWPMMTNSCTTLKVYVLRQKPHLFTLRSLNCSSVRQCHWSAIILIGSDSVQSFLVHWLLHQSLCIFYGIMFDVLTFNDCAYRQDVIIVLHLTSCPFVGMVVEVE